MFNLNYFLVIMSIMLLLFLFLFHIIVFYHPLISNSFHLLINSYFLDALIVTLYFISHTFSPLFYSYILFIKVQAAIQG
jgi:hypothetical protein